MVEYSKQHSQAALHWMEYILYASLQVEQPLTVWPLVFYNTLNNVYNETRKKG